MALATDLESTDLETQRAANEMDRFHSTLSEHPTLSESGVRGRGEGRNLSRSRKARPTLTTGGVKGSDAESGNTTKSNTDV